MSHRTRWAGILAGGEGRRLRSFTKALLGDDRPKQFCRLLGQHTLLGETRHRVSQNVEPTRTLHVVTQAHEEFYRQELAGVPGELVVEQPSNRGTTIAVMYLMARAAMFDADGLIGLFPADHYYRDLDAFRRTIDDAYALADAHPEAVILVGAEADRAETEYGWIEPGAALPSHVPLSPGTTPARRVTRFCEKPAASVAMDLLERGCLWNTLVLVGRIRAFEDLVTSAIPALLPAFDRLRECRSFSEQSAIASQLYRTTASSDFSQDVLSHQPERLIVTTLSGGGWTDLGQPERVLDVVARRRMPLAERRVASL